VIAWSARWSHWKDHVVYALRAPAAYVNWWVWPLPKLGRTVTLETRQGLRYQVRGKTPDLSVINETTIKNPYLRHPCIHLEPGSVIVDVGANIGDFTFLASRIAIHGRVIAVEPIGEHVEALRVNKELNRAEHVDIVQAALGKFDGELTMVVDGPKSRAHAGPNVTVWHEQVRVMTLPTLMQLYGLSHIDLLKLDCEGAEWDILQAAEPVIEAVQQIALEYHLIGEWSLDSLTQWLETHGLQLTAQGRGWLGLLWARRANLA
jgi:FkbM family methyltransferase